MGSDTGSSFVFDDDNSSSVGIDQIIGSAPSGAGAEIGDGRGGGNNSPGSDPAPFGYLPNGKPRKRRPNGQRGPVIVNGKAAQALPSVDALAGAIFALNATLAAVAKAPELGIDRDEARTLAKSAADVMILHGGSIDPRAMVWANLILAVGGVYGPRVGMLMMRKRAEKQEAIERADKERNPPQVHGVARAT